MQTFLALLVAGFIPCAVFADSFHVPTPQGASDRLGLSVRMFDGDRKAEQDDPVLVEIEFSEKLRIKKWELILRKLDRRLGVFTADLKNMDSVLKPNHRFLGYSCELAPSVLATSYLQISLKSSDDLFYVPLLRFIPEKHIDKNRREASPDFRSEISKLITQAWPTRPEFLVNLQKQQGKAEKQAETQLFQNKTGKEILEDVGIQFPAGSVIFYGLATSELRVHNTEDNIKQIDLFVKGEKSR